MLLLLFEFELEELELASDAASMPGSAPALTHVVPTTAARHRAAARARTAPAFTRASSAAMAAASGLRGAGCCGRALFPFPFPPLPPPPPRDFLPPLLFVASRSIACSSAVALAVAEEAKEAKEEAAAEEELEEEVEVEVEVEAAAACSE